MNTLVRILVVDDDADIARGTAHLLERAGYVTTTASNGVEALRAMPTFRLHLVLTDRDMPEMDGVALCRGIKGDPALAGIFVVLISGVYTQSEQQAGGLESGADGYITRPVANRELLARVESYARIFRLQMLSLRPARWNPWGSWPAAWGTKSTIRSWGSSTTPN